MSRVTQFLKSAKTLVILGSLACSLLGVTQAQARPSEAAAQFDAASSSYDRSFNDFYKAYRDSPTQDAAATSKILSTTVIPAQESYLEAAYQKFKTYMSKEFGVPVTDTVPKTPAEAVSEKEVLDDDVEPLKPGEVAVTDEDVFGKSNVKVDAGVPKAVATKGVSDSVVVEGDQKGKEYRYPGKTKPGAAKK